MRRPPSGSSFPEAPELPSFRVEGEAPAEPVARHEGTGLVRHDVRLADDRIDEDAARVVKRLERAGYEAYLVGGCVRDLLLDGTPKDFDVATSARPEDVRGLFRNCRIIGRRFRLAHVLFGGGKVIEVATFRKKPAEAFDEDNSELLIRNDNAFGDAHEDALRRDFTINALFYDLTHHQVLDWCGGMQHIEQRVIQTIGDPVVRFREDPVRMLRVIKFAARLDLGIAPDVHDALVVTREELIKAAKPRVFEELMRLLRGGAGARSVWLLWEMGILSLLLPELSSVLDDDDDDGTRGRKVFGRLAALDAMTKERKAPFDDIVLTTALLYEPLVEAISGSRDVLTCAGDFLEPLVRRVALPRRIADAVRRIIAIMPRIEEGRLGRFARTELAGAAVDLHEAELRAGGQPLEKARALRRLVQESAAREPRAPRGRPRAPTPRN